MILFRPFNTRYAQQVSTLGIQVFYTVETGVPSLS